MNFNNIKKNFTTLNKIIAVFTGSTTKSWTFIINLNIEIMGRGMAWLDTGTHDDLLAAAQFIETIEKRQGLKINCPEEVAYRNGWLSDEEIYKIAEPLIKSGYGNYLLSLVNKREF